MEVQKEALRRIISTLANKNDELQNFLETVNNTMIGLQEESQKMMSELQLELQQLTSTLEDRGAELHDAIKEEKQRKEMELQKQLSDGQLALLSSEELLEFATQTLMITNEEEFLMAAKEIKERVTMAPAFRLTMRPAVTESMSHFTVNFDMEKAWLRQLHFLPVPKAPEIDASSCTVRDNTITVAWRSPSNSVADDDGRAAGIEHYELEFHKTNCDRMLQAVREACWEKIEDIHTTEFTIKGLKFNSCFVVIRVRARNKAAAGEFSEPIAVETRAFNFGFDAMTAHPELKVHGDTVTWEPQGVKGHDARLKNKENKGRSATPSPNKMATNRQGRDRFAGDSYTVLGDQEMSAGCHYWEMCPMADWKSFSVGVAYRASLGRFDQLGKHAGSWCLYASQWLQSSLAAKHNNRAKALDLPLPQRIGIYCDYDNGDLLFIDVDHLRLLHCFKTKFSQPLIPAFTVWCGSICISTGLQVPSFMGTFLSTNRSISNLSQ
ncbi:FSD1-like protein isoform X2 [Thalassophryne amazonica]|uniref:FSD1-like protein isoform X2 n=1 Tax=Thalassophryne amazonica TaxID=390379 RepID=UPI0014721F60|nr:FSD1-like protein isoform X2 [Thalassophryne amazonica]